MGLRNALLYYCQTYGHVKNYCHHKSRCVSSGDGHHTEHCTKVPTSSAKCALCTKDYTANYLRFPVAFKVDFKSRDNHHLNNHNQSPKINQPFTAPLLKSAPSQSEPTNYFVSVFSDSNIINNINNNNSPYYHNSYFLRSKLFPIFMKYRNFINFLSFRVFNHHQTSHFSHYL